MKKQKGVTLISMVIMIIVVILLASYSVLSSRDLITETNMQTYYQEIKLVQESLKGLSVDKEYFKESLEPYKISDIGMYNSMVGNNLEYDKDSYYFGFGEESMDKVVRQTLYELLDLRNISNSYIVTFIGEGKVKVFLVDGVKSGNETFYTYEEMHDAYSNVTQK